MIADLELSSDSQAKQTTTEGRDLAQLPPLRALQIFEVFGRLGTVHATAQDLNITPGAVSQQLRLLEEHLDVVLLTKDGRRAALTPAARGYHELVTQGFGRLLLAQDYIAEHRVAQELTISCLPTLLQRWLNPLLPSFQASTPDASLRLIAENWEPDSHRLEYTFRLTYGAAGRIYAHSRALFTDYCFPAASPDFLARHPEATTPEGLSRLPLIGIDWGAQYTTEPYWRDWFKSQLQGESPQLRHVAVYSISAMGLEAAAAGRGAVLAQGSFAQADLDSGRLVRLSPDQLPLPDPYYICWGQSAIDRPIARHFLDWLMQVTRPLRRSTQQEN